jgi:hypothetical protein
MVRGRATRARATVPQRALDAGLDLLEQRTVPGVPMPGALGEAGVKRLVLRRFPYDIVSFPKATRLLFSPSLTTHADRPTGGTVSGANTRAEPRREAESA